MIEFTFEVNGQGLRRTDRVNPAGDVVGQLWAVFEFDDWWEDTFPIARFMKSGVIYDVEIIDAETKYKRNRSKEELDDIRNISSPMPGKIVKIPVKVGDHVKAGDTVVIVSAMKMESEYKVQKDRVVRKINVKEGDIVEGNQVLIVVE